MNAFSKLVPPALAFLAAFAAESALCASPVPVISGPWTEVRTAPVLESTVEKLAPVWGPALPMGAEFKVEKVYGRWLYGTPLPLAHMRPKDYAKPGWVFSRMLLVPGDEDTLSPLLQQASRSVLYHGRAAWKKLGLGKEPILSPLDFLESLTLSKGTMKAFRAQDETGLAWLPDLPPLLPAIFGSADDAHAAESAKDPAEDPGEKTPSMGLTGTDLNFLDQDFKVKQEGIQKREQDRSAKRLRPPPLPPLTEPVKNALLGRFMLQKYLVLPPLSQEEVDGFIYMRAVTMRALEGCPKTVKEFWKNRRWNQFRVFRLQSRPESPQPWLQVALPGGYFAQSARAIDVANNEAELAFLLVRPLVRELRIQRPKPKFAGKPWPGALHTLSEELWDQELRIQSTKDAENLDVGDEIAVDMAAVECISRAGYRPRAGLTYLQKLAAKRNEPWAAWFAEHAIGIDYRLERVAALIDESVAQHRFPEGVATNPKRFLTASRFWNILP